MPDPWSIEAMRTALLLLSITVAGLDLGIAFLMRAEREAGSTPND